jgi:outer membrane protein TolC
MSRLLSRLACLVLVVPASLRAAPAPAVAEAYVAEALQRNLALSLQTLEVEQARERLREARSAFQPRLDFVARYTRSDGGRTIEFPTGDLLNGVYGTLNDYLQRSGRPAVFPQLANESIPLLRPREQETKLRLVQPLWRPEIARTARAGRAAVAAREAQVAAFRRELRLTVLAGYFACEQAEAAVEILTATAALTGEAVRTSRLLAEADKITDDRVLRAEAEDLTIRQQLAEATRDRNAARRYFNFLLNRDPDAPIARADPAELGRITANVLDAAGPNRVGVDGREELELGRRAVAAAAAAEAAVRARLYPTVALAVEGGLQGEEYRTGRDDRFVQGSVVAEMNIWDGRQRHSELQQARIERRRAELQLDETRRKLVLQAQQAADDLVAARAAYRAATRRAEASARAFELVRQREQAGLVNQLNFTDARAEKTRAELNQAIVAARLLVAAATLDRATAASPVP